MNIRLVYVYFQDFHPFGITLFTFSIVSGGDDPVG